uniref:C2H2-type domain-containing protein n=1 Tax=Anabas testudineus TaxID=64144 RepID=A0AAQ6IG01_ANATE
MAAATLQSFNVFLTERLSAAAVDIYGFVERTLVDYQEEVHRTKMENQRLQRLLDLVYKPEIRLHRAGMILRSVRSDSSSRGRWVRTHRGDSLTSVTAHHGDHSKHSCVIGKQRNVLFFGCYTPKNIFLSTVTDSRQTNLPRPTQEVCAQEQQIQKECIFREAKEEPVTLPFKEERTELWTSKSHDGKGNFDCHVCGKHIPCQSNLQNHMRVHTGERPYSCHFCGKCFKLKGHMTEHIRTHTGEKPFSCHICDKSFNRGNETSLMLYVVDQHRAENRAWCLGIYTF